MATSSPPIPDPGLTWFFEGRAAAVSAAPTLQELCYVSGRDPRLWADARLYDDLIASIREQLQVRPDMSLLEVGCAAGFLARGLCSLCARYTGIDIAPAAVKAASRLRLPNAHFRTADATSLPYAEGTFDRVINYDVFINIADLGVAKRIMAEMVRVAKPGGKIMIGSLGDAARQAELEAKCRQVAEELQHKAGLPHSPQAKPRLSARLRQWYAAKVLKIQPKAVCYYHFKTDFATFGAEYGLGTRIFDIHALNPYRGYRYNVVYTKGTTQ